MVNQKEKYDCDGRCGRTFWKTDLLTVPSSKERRICDECAEKYFDIPIDEEDKIPEPINE